MKMASKEMVSTERAVSVVRARVWEIVERCEVGATPTLTDAHASRYEKKKL